MSKTLDHKEKHLMRLIRISADDTGWAPVSNAVWPVIQQLPSELVEIRNSEAGKFARLIHDGEVILNWS